MDSTIGVFALKELKARTHRDEYQRFSTRFFVFTPKRFSLTMSRVNMQIHSLTLDGTHLPCNTTP